MPEENGREGLKVVSPDMTAWTCYGDANLFKTDQDSHKAVNMEQCRDALKQSVEEVHEAYKNGSAGEVMDEKGFSAWQFAPEISRISELNPKHHPLLFVGKDGKLYTRNGGRRVQRVYAWTVITLSPSPYYGWSFTGRTSNMWRTRYGSIWGFDLRVQRTMLVSYCDVHWFRNDTRLRRTLQ